MVFRVQRFPRFLILFSLLIMMGAASVGRGDSFVTTSQRTFEVETNQYLLNAGKGYFMMRMAGDAAGAQLHPVELGNIEQILFGAPGANSGRRASGVMADGRAFNDIVVLKAVREAGGLAIYLRLMSDPPAKMNRVELSQIGRINFAEALPASVAVPMPAPVYPPERDGIDESDEEDEDAEEIAALIGKTEWSEEDVEAIQERVQRSRGQAGSSSSSSSRPATMSQRMKLPRFLTANYFIPGIGVAIDVLSFLIYLIVSTAFGGTFLYMSSQVENIEGYPIWKSYVAAAAISVASPIAFRIVAFIPIYGFTLGLFAFFFTTRAIVMGAMEILEDKANEVMFTYLVIQIACLIGVALILNKLL